MPTFHVSDLKVLFRLFAKDKYQIVVFHPQMEIKTDIPFGFKSFKLEKELEEWVVMNNDKTLFLVNFSDKPLHTLYGLAHVGSHMKFSKKTIEKEEKSFFFINNPDGTMRWIFPVDNKWPSHLELYNASSWKAKAYKMASALLFRFGGKKVLANGQFSIVSKEPLLLEDGVSGIEYDQYSIFTGTVSTGRKAIMEISKNGNTNHFLKIPIEEEAKAYLLREFQELNSMKALSFKYMKIPGVRQLSNGILLENIKPEPARNSVELEPMHFDALEELYEQTAKEEFLNTLPIYEEITNNLKELEACMDLIQEPLSYKQITGIIEKLNLLFTGDTFKDKCVVTRAHGDFTPWNMYQTDFKLHLYDWELAREKMPILFDCFHFIFQAGVLIRSFSWQEISQELETLHQSPFFGRLVKKHSIDFDIYIKVYLLYTVSSYLPRYIRQKPLHKQVFWLIDIWEAALNELVENTPEIRENVLPKPANVS